MYDLIFLVFTSRKLQLSSGCRYWSILRVLRQVALLFAVLNRSLPTVVDVAERPDVYPESSPTYGNIHSDLSVMYKQLQLYSAHCKGSLSLIYIELFISTDCRNQTKPHQTLGYRWQTRWRETLQNNLVNLVIRETLCLVLFNVKKYKQLYIKHFRVKYRQQDTVY